VQANQIGRTLALVVFAVLGVTLLFPRVADRLMAPFVRLGGVLQKKADAGGAGVGSSLLLGASIGLLWAPCAGPILGLVLAGAALGGSNQKTFGLLFVFALGAATSLGIAIRASGSLMKTLKKGLGAEEWIRRFLGVAVLGAVVAIAFGLDTKVLSKLSYLNTNSLEQSLVDRASGTAGAEKSSELAPEGMMPSLQGAGVWLNSQPLTSESLRGKVVLVDFWTYSCINCLRTLPYVKAWADKYRDQGLVVVGVHAPEFAFEKDERNVRTAVRDLGVTYPVALDNELTIWNAFKNQYWPAHYFIDAQGRIRHHHFGEGGYEESERVIQELLKEAHGGKLAAEIPLTTEASLASSAAGAGVQAPPSGADQVASPETYVGYDRQEGFVGQPEIARDAVATYQTPASLQLNQWAFSGPWRISAESAHLEQARGTLSFRFKARDLHLVIGAGDSRKIRYRVTIDGHAPGADHGMDTDEAGNGTASGHRLFQLIRLKNGVGERTFKIEFMDSGAEVFAFTFG
jgi:thiol-disulfide isomerase/thioredoxin